MLGHNRFDWWTPSENDTDAIRRNLDVTAKTMKYDDAIRAGVVSVAQGLHAAHSDLGAILLECSDLPRTIGEMLRQSSGKGLDRLVQIEQDRPSRIIAHHALNPEEAGHPRAPRDRRDLMQGRRRIKNAVARRQLDRLRAVAVFDQQFAPIILLWVGQKERAGQIGADALARAGNGTDRIVHMDAEILRGFVSVEQRRQDAFG